MRAVSMIRLLAALAFVAVATFLVVVSSRDRGLRDDAPADLAVRTGSPELIVTPGPADDLAAATADEESDFPVERVDAATEERRRAEWRFVAGVARRGDTGFLTDVRVTGRNLDGRTTETRSSNSFVGFTAKITPETTELVLVPSATDLEQVTVPLRTGEDWTTLDVTLPVARGLLRARVVDETGGGVPGVVVAAGSRARRTSDSRGNVFFRPLRDDSYSVWLTNVPFSTYGSSRRTVQVKGGVPTEPVVFTVPRGATLRGSVLEEGTQAPVAGVDIILTQPEARRSHRAARSDAKGYFEFLGLVPGAYRLAAAADDGLHGRIVVDLATIRRDEIRSVEVTLSTGIGQLVGRALDHDGAPVPFAAIEACRVSDAGAERLSTRTDSHGRFKLRSLPAGTWSVGPSAAYCRSHNWVDGKAATVTVRPGEETEVQVQLRAGSFLEGRVVSESDRRGLIVRVHLDAETVLERSIGHEGRFAFGGVEPGTYLIEAIDLTQSADVALASRMVYVTSGENVTVQLDVP